MTCWRRSRRPGASPSGETRPGEHHVLVAAGSGITPVLSIAATLLRDRDAEVSLLLADRSSASAMFVDEVAELKDRWPTRLAVTHLLSREPRDSELLSGRLDGERFAEVLDALVPWREAHGFWLCGPWPMVTALREVLAGRGVPGRLVHSELFFVEDTPPPVPAPVPRSGPVPTMQVTLEGRTTQVAAGAGHGAGRGAGGAGRGALRLPWRGVRHLPGAGRRGRGRDAT